MLVKIIKDKNLTLYLYDTSTRSETYIKNFSRLLKSALKVINNWQKAFQTKCQIEFSLTLCGEQKIKTLNHQYRNKNKITDVLSFPLEETPLLMIKTKRNMPPILNLGDIFICKNVARVQGKEFKISLEQEMIYLTIHGFLHLLGYDHERGDLHEKKMFRAEGMLTEKIFKTIKVK